MKRRANSILLIALICVLAGLFTFTVYATFTATLRFSNIITFTTDPNQVFFKAKVTVKNSNDEIISGPYSLDRHNSTYSSTNDTITIDTLTFSRTNNVIYYELEVENYSEFKIKVSIVESSVVTGNQYIGNVVSTPTCNIDRMPASLTPNTGSLTMRTQCKSFTKSFQIDNSFKIKIEELNN